MGQYHYIVNLTKREFINPHKLASGLKVGEQLASGMTGRAMIVLMCCPDKRGGGDLEPNRAVGRWHGDHVVMVGDYAEDGDFPSRDKPSEIYSKCGKPRGFKDISDQVCKVIEKELNGKFVGNGWRDFVSNETGLEVRS